MSAMSLGRSAGLLLLSPGLNPFPEWSQDEKDWDRAWRLAAYEVLEERNQERRRKVSSECGHLTSK